MRSFLTAVKTFIIIRFMAQMWKFSFYVITGDAISDVEMQSVLCSTTVQEGQGWKSRSRPW